MRSKKLLFYLFSILMLSMSVTQAFADVVLKGSFDNWGDGIPMTQVGTLDRWRAKIHGSTLNGKQFKIVDNNNYRAKTNGYPFNLTSSQREYQTTFGLSDQGSNMTINCLTDVNYIIDLQKGSTEYILTISEESFLQVRGLSTATNAWSSDQAGLTYNSTTEHWTGTISLSQLNANNKFKLYDGTWHGNDQAFNLRYRTTQTFSSIITDGGDDHSISLITPGLPSDATYDLDIVWESTGYKVTITRQKGIPLEIRGFGNWGADNCNMTYDSSTGKWTGYILNQNLGGKELKLYDGRFWSGHDNNNNEIQINSGYIGNNVNDNQTLDIRTNTSATALFNGDAGNPKIKVPASDPSNTRYDFEVSLDDNANGYNVKVTRNKREIDVYIGGSISSDGGNTVITGSNQTWSQHDSDNLKMTYDATAGAYYIDFTAQQFANSNRLAQLNTGTGMDFRFVEKITVNDGTPEYKECFPSSSPLTLTDTYQTLTTGTPGNSYIAVTPATNAIKYRVWFKDEAGTRSAKVDVVVPEIYINGSMSNDPENTEGTGHETWTSGAVENLKLTPRGNGEYYIDFSPTAFSLAKRTNYIGLDFRFFQRITENGVNSDTYLYPDNNGQGYHLTDTPCTLISGNTYGDNYLGVEEVDRATNYRIYLKRTESAGVVSYLSWAVVNAPYATLTVTGGSTISGVPTTDGYTFTIPQTSNYTPGQTLTFQVEVNDGINSSQYIPTTTIGEKDHAYTYIDLAASACNITYGVPANAADEIIVTLNTNDNTISLTHENVGHAGTNQQYYVVGSWFDTTFDNVNYNERRFQMKKNSNGTYYFDIPANMNLRCQIISSTGTLYYPANNSDYELHGGWTSVSDQAVYSAAKPSTDTWGGNWYFHGNKDKITIPDGIAKIVVTENDVTTTYLDGYFHLTFDPANSKWSVTYSTKRVSYLSAAANDWKVDFLYDESRDHRHFGSAYIDTGGFKILNAWSNHNQNPSLYPNTKLIEKGNNGQNGLLGGANLDLTPMTGTSQNGHIIPMSAKGLYLVEDDPTRGNQVYTGENSWDNLLLFNSSGGTDPNPVFQTISLVGPAFPETMTGTDWDPTKAIDMHYDAEEQCFKANVSTTLAAGQVFRFVADHSITTNWGEESTADADQARVPYDEAGTGHAATADDRNVVKITNDATATNRNGSGNYGDIVFNRPAGNWVIRFYLSTPDTKVTSFYYTISESVEPDVTLSPQSGIYESATLTPTTVESETHYNMTVNVQVVNATKYKYTIGQDVSLDDTGVEVVDYNSANPFGTFRYNGDAESPRVWFTPYDGTETELTSPATLVVNGSQATVYVNVVAADGSGNSNSAERTYVYTFAPSAALEAISSQGGSFINKTTVNIVGGKGTLYYTTGGDAMNETNRKHVPANRQVVVSRPGTMTVTDGYTTETAEFQFTYSTSENYTNFWHNTPGEVVYAGGGKDATSVFIEVEDNMPMRIYAWNYSKDQMLIEQQEKKQTGYSETAEGFNERDPQVKLTSYYPGTVLDESRLLTIGGKKFFYLVVPKEKLKYTDKNGKVAYGEMAVILSRSTRASTTLDADYYKTPNTIVDANSTFEYFSSPNTMSGSDVTSYNSYLAMPVNDDLTKIYGDNVVFIEVPSTWTSAYCYAWNSTGNNGWPGVRMSHVKTLPSGNQVFACQLTTKFATSDTKLIFTESGQGKGDPKRWDNEEEKMVFTSRGYYTAAGPASRTIDTDPGVSQTISDWISHDYSEMEDYTVFPNGEEYHDMRPDDKTYMLDPTWGGVISKPTDILDEEWSITHWSGYPVTSETTEGGFRKRITNTMNLTQTVLHLDKDKEYTVQALVRSTGESGTKVRLTLNGASEEYDEEVARNAGGGGNVGSGVEGSFVTKTGRVEYLTPTEFTKMNKQNGIGWFKLQAKAYPDAATGNLQITISSPNGDWFDLADVVLLEDADRPDGTTYRTTATKINETVTYGTGTLEMDTYADYRDWASTASSQKNNAFSFFDRGENRNAVVFANEHTVLCLDGHKHPYNVVKTTSDSDENGVCPVLYLTDMGVGDVLQSTASAEYKGSGYTFKSVIPFTATNVVYDRSYALTKSTIILPFSLTQAQIKAAYGSNVKVYKFKEYHAETKDVVFSKLRDEVGNEEVLVANQPYILFNASGTLDSRSATQAAAKPSTMSIPEVNALDNLYPATEETSVDGAFTGRFDYARMSTYNEGKTKTEAYYGYNNNQFLIVNSAGANMKPFRAYFTVPYSGESTLAPALSISFLDEPQVTGITDVEDHSQKDGYIYSVNGMLIRRDSRTDSLPKGIYILNGRKFVVK